MVMNKIVVITVIYSHTYQRQSIGRMESDKKLMQLTLD